MLFGGRRRSCEGGGRGTRRRRKWMARRRIAAPGLRRPSRSPELAETVTTALAAAQLVRGCICRLPRCRLGIAVSHPSTLYWASNHRPNYEMIIGCTYWATFRPNIFWGDLFFLSHHRLCIVCSVLMLSNAALFVSWDFLIAK